MRRRSTLTWTSTPPRPTPCSASTSTCSRRSSRSRAWLAGQRTSSSNTTITGSSARELSTSAKSILRNTFPSKTDKLGFAAKAVLGQGPPSAFCPLVQKCEHRFRVHRTCRLEFAAFVEKHCLSFGVEHHYARHSAIEVHVISLNNVGILFAAADVHMNHAEGTLHCRREFRLMEHRIEDVAVVTPVPAKHQDRLLAICGIGGKRLCDLLFRVCLLFIQVRVEVSEGLDEHRAAAHDGKKFRRLSGLSYESELLFFKTGLGIGCAPLHLTHRGDHDDAGLWRRRLRDFRFEQHEPLL